MTPTHDAAIRELDRDESLRLLSKATIGRFAIATEHGVDIFPVNFLVHEGAIYFRSAPGSKLMDLANEPAVTFEADGKRGRQWWSVVVHGTGERLSSDAEITKARVNRLHTESPTEKWNYVRVFPLSITGRSFRMQPRLRPISVSLPD